MKLTLLNGWHMELTSIFQTGNPIVLGMAKEMLDQAGIDFLVRGEDLQNVIGIGTFGGYNPITGPAQILVRPEDVEKAVELIHDLEP